MLKKNYVFGILLTNQAQFFPRKLEIINFINVRPTFLSGAGQSIRFKKSRASSASKTCFKEQLIYVTN